MADSAPANWRSWSLCGGLLSVALLAVACGQASESDSVLAVQRVSQPLEISDFVIGTDTPALIQYDAGWYPGVATSTSSRIVVFEDTARIQAVLFDDEGPIGLDWIDLGVDDVVQYYPSVAVGEDRYLVAWYESAEAGPAVYGQTLSIEGEVLSERKLLADAAYDVQIDWLDGAFVFAWNDGAIHLSRVDLDAELIDGTRVDVTDMPASRPVLATLDDQGIVAFAQGDNEARQVLAVRFDATGAVLDPGGVVVNPSIDGTPEVAVAAGDAEYLVAFRGADGEGVIASVVDDSGQLVASEQVVSTSDSIGGHAVGFDGERFAVVWGDASIDGGALVASHVSKSGEVEPVEVTVAGPPAIASSVNYLDLDFSDGRYVVVYRADGVRGQYFDADLSRLGDPLALSAFPNAQNIPTPIWDGTNYVLAWSDERDFGAYQMRGTRISAEGAVLDPAGLGLSQEGAMAGNISVGSNGQVTVFVWIVNEDEAAYLRTMNADAELTPTQLFAVGRPRSARVLGGKKNFLVVYTIGPDATSNVDSVYAQPLDATGVPQGEAVPIVTGVAGLSASSFELAGEYWVAYDAGGAGALLQLSDQGEVLTELALPEDTGEFYNAAANDSSKLFIWQDASDQVYGRLLEDESWGEPFSLTDQLAAGTPAVAFDGSRFVTVWVEDRTALWTRSVELDGSLGEESRLLEGDYSQPRLTASGGETMLLSMVHWETYARTRRIESRLVAADGVVIAEPPGVEEPVQSADEGSDDAPPAGVGGDDAQGDAGAEQAAADDTSGEDVVDATDMDDSSGDSDGEALASDDGAAMAEGVDDATDTSSEGAGLGDDADSAGDEEADDGSGEDDNVGATGGGSADAGADDAAANSASDSSGCDCAMLGSNPTPGDVKSFWALLLVGLLAVRRRPRTTPTTSKHRLR
jgi:MYXO-CTERM domain-containing protein